MITLEDVAREYKAGDLSWVDAVEDLERIGYGKLDAWNWTLVWDDDKRASAERAGPSAAQGKRSETDPAQGRAAQEGSSRGPTEDQSG